jgi:hypothetical protein
MVLFLTLVSGVAWSVVYIELIRCGFKDKTYGMPLFALGLNFAWELIYSYTGLILQPAGFIASQTYVNICWVVLDVLIIATYFKYGKERYIDETKHFFLPWSILVFAVCFVLQFAFYFDHAFTKFEAGRYAAFLQNVAMSILFIHMFFTRKDTRGQSLTIAIPKWIGTLAPTILLGYLQEVNIFVILCGILCSIFDIIYIILLFKKKCILKTKAE